MAHPFDEPFLVKGGTANPWGRLPNTGEFSAGHIPRKKGH